jgi:hypothetical protein
VCEQVYHCRRLDAEMTHAPHSSLLSADVDCVLCDEVFKNMPFEDDTDHLTAQTRGTRLLTFDSKVLQAEVHLVCFRILLESKLVCARPRMEECYHGFVKLVICLSWPKKFQMIANFDEPELNQSHVFVSCKAR